MEITYTLEGRVTGNKKLKREIWGLFKENLSLGKDKSEELYDELSTIGVWDSGYVNSLLFLYLKYKNIDQELSIQEERFVKYYILTENGCVWVEDKPYLAEYVNFKEKELESMFEPAESDNEQNRSYTIRKGKNYLKYKEKADEALTKMGSLHSVSLDEMYENFQNNMGHKISVYFDVKIDWSEDIKQDLLAEDLSDVFEMIQELYKKNPENDNTFVSEVMKNCDNKEFVKNNIERILESVDYGIDDIFYRIMTTYALNILFKNSFGKLLLLTYFKNMNRNYNHWHILEKKKMHNEIKKFITLLKKSLIDSSNDREIKNYYKKYHLGWWD